MPTPEEIMAMRLRTYPMPPATPVAPPIEGRPDVNTLYGRLSSLVGQQPDYSGVEQVAAARRGEGQRDFLAGLMLSGMGGESARPLGQVLAAQGIETAKPLRANAADVGYYNPETGKFIENPLARQQREEKVLQSRIDALVKEKEHAANLAMAQGKVADARVHMQNAEALKQLTTAIAAQTATANAHLAEAKAHAAENKTDFKRLNSAEQAKLNTGVTTYHMLDRTEKAFKDEYAGGISGTPGAEASNYVARNFPKAAEYMPGLGGKKGVEAMRAKAEFWANQKFFDEIPTRHEFFGSALTPGEAASWKAAAIQPGMDPKDIRANLEMRRKIAYDAIKRTEDMHLSNKIIPEAVYALTGQITGGSGKGESTQVAPPADGSWVEHSPGVRMRKVQQ